MLRRNVCVGRFLCCASCRSRTSARRLRNGNMVLFLGLHRALNAAGLRGLTVNLCETTWLPVGLCTHSCRAGARNGAISGNSSTLCGRNAGDGLAYSAGSAGNYRTAHAALDM